VIKAEEASATIPVVFAVVKSTVPSEVEDCVLVERAKVVSVSANNKMTSN